MDGVRYRSYVVRAWVADPADPAAVRVRIEWIAPGIVVERHGAWAAELAACLEAAFEQEPATEDGPREMVASTRDRGRD